MPVYVDIPNPNAIGMEDNAWINVGRFTSTADAVAWIRENIDPSCDDKGRIQLISGSPIINNGEDD